MVSFWEKISSLSLMICRGRVAQAIIQKTQKPSLQKHVNGLPSIGLSCLKGAGTNLAWCQSFAEFPINHHGKQESQQAFCGSYSEIIAKLDSLQSLKQMFPHGSHETWLKFQLGWYRVIMLNYTYPQNIKNMTNINNNDPDAFSFSYMHQNYYLNNLSFEQDPIEQFLNEQAFLDRQVSYKHSEQSNDLTSVNPASIQVEQSQIDETQQTNRKKSIFHNFQKHLITLIKKIIVLPLVSSTEDTEASLMVRVWTAFKKTRSFNKKVLHMVFGVCETGNAEEELRKLAQEYPQFRPILENSSVTEIQQAQTAIRQEVLRQSSALDRSALSGCNVNRFEEFYEYFQSFLCELASGPMAKRMTKTRKHVVVERLKNKQRME